MQRLLVTLLYSLPALSNVGCIMLLFFTVYGIIGMNLFGDMVYGDYLNNHANFDNFPNSMLVLMRYDDDRRLVLGTSCLVLGTRYCSCEFCSGVPVGI